jgi:hypothetical protein
MFDEFLSAAGLGDLFGPLVAKKCETRKELATWFVRFAAECRAARGAKPEQPAAK